MGDVHADSPERMAQLMEESIEQGVVRAEVGCKRKDNSMFPALLSGFLLRNSDGQLVAAGILRDLSEQKQMEAERETMQQQIIAAQRNALRELSTPLIPITDEVVIMPLIGTIDSQRAQQVMEALLEGVAQHQADLVILDITGVSVVDTQVAQSFIQAAHAVRLLGAQVMLTGIQPQIAQTLVHLGVDLSGIQTQGSLQAGIAAALTKRQDA
jgi:anti-anti-sigma factor